MKTFLRRRGEPIGRKRVQRLMRLMGLVAQGFILISMAAKVLFICKRFVFLKFKAEFVLLP
jgi:hypothetical protein